MKPEMKRIPEVEDVFRKRLNDKMHAANVSQMQLSKVTGIQQNKISRILGGKTRIILQDYVILMERIDLEFAMKMREMYGEAYKEAIRRYILCKLWTYPVSGIPGIDLAFGTVYVSAPSKPLCPSLSLHEGVSWLHSINSSKDAGMFANVYCVDGVWATAAIAHHYNKVQPDFQCQPQLGQTACA